MGESFFVPLQIKELTLDVGSLRQFEAKFKKNSVNAIHGPGMSGKSTIIRSILHAFGIQHKYFDADHTIIMRTYAEKVGKCLLIDDAFETLRTDLLPSALKELRKLHTQVIATFRCQDLKVIQANFDQVIVLPKPELS